MLTQPDSDRLLPDTDDEQSFSIERAPSALKCLNVYKRPLLLHEISVRVDTSEEMKNAIHLVDGRGVIDLRAPSSNSRILWQRQLQAATDLAKSQVPVEEQLKERASSAEGRLIVSIHQILNYQLLSSVSADRFSTLLCMLRMDKNRATHYAPIEGPHPSARNLVDLNVELDRRMLSLSDGVSVPPVSIVLRLHQLYAPDIDIATCQIDAKELIAAGINTRGVLSRSVLFERIHRTFLTTAPSAVIKFAFHPYR